MRGRDRPLDPPGADSPTANRCATVHSSAPKNACGRSLLQCDKWKRQSCVSNPRTMNRFLRSLDGGSWRSHLCILYVPEKATPIASRSVTHRMVEKRVPDCLGLKVSVHFLSTFDTPPLPMSHPTSLGAAHGRDHVRVCDNSGD